LPGPPPFSGATAVYLYRRHVGNTASLLIRQSNGADNAPDPNVGAAPSALTFPIRCVSQANFLNLVPQPDWPIAIRGDWADTHNA
jgi:hypothetical protein